MTQPNIPTQPPAPPVHAEPMQPPNAALWTQVLNTIVSCVLIVAVTYLSAIHDLQVGVVSAIFVTLIAHQFGSFTIGRRADDPPR